MLHKLLQTGAIVTSVTGAAFVSAAFAQDSRLNIPLNQKNPPTQEEIDRQKAADKAYSAAMHKIPDKKPPTDPWGDIRPSSSAASKNKQQ
jgi:hypothetical protein